MGHIALALIGVALIVAWVIFFQELEHDDEDDLDRWRQDGGR